MDKVIFTVFPGLCIVHKAVKEVPEWLFKKQNIEGLSQKDIKRLHKQCAIAAKKINLNVLRLKFSAYSIDTNEIICEPVFSDPINNLKSAATNILKICRMSRCNSRAVGGEDVIMLTEKVVKKNIVIRFFELSENGEEVWQSTGQFLDSDVHHQYAISFRTPPYKDINTTKKVKVYVELLRPSDGQRSKPEEFSYTPQFHVAVAGKKRKLFDNYETPPWTPKNINDNRGRDVENCDHTKASNQMKQFNSNKDDLYGSQNSLLTSKSDPMFGQTQPIPTQTTNNYRIQDYYNEGLKEIMIGTPIEDVKNSETEMENYANLQPKQNINISDNAVRQIDSQATIEDMEPKECFDMDILKEFSLHDLYGDDILTLLKTADEQESTSQLLFLSDSGRGKIKRSGEPDENIISPNSSSAQDDASVVKQMTIALKAFLKTIPAKNDINHKDEMMIQSLEELFKLRLSNGDNFLHMALSTKQPLLTYIIHNVHHFNMEHLLNMKNDRLQTILHVAIINDIPDIVSFLISKGCDPMLGDIDGNNAIHYTLMCQTCLNPLLEAIQRGHIQYDLNATNYDMQTALHLSVIYKDASSAYLLLKEGSDFKVKDSEGRSPLHLAAYDDCLSVARVLLEHMQPEDVNEVDERGYSALQIVCNGQLRPNTMELVKVLLEFKADPMKEGRFMSAWYLVKNKPELKEIMMKYLQQPLNDEEHISSDEFESADDGSDSEVDNEEVASPKTLDM